MLIENVMLSAMAAVMVLVPLIAIASRVRQGKGIGWQFIRFNAIAIALPLIGILSLTDGLNEGVLPVIATVLGYAFAKSEDKEA